MVSFMSGLVFFFVTSVFKSFTINLFIENELNLQQPRFVIIVIISFQGENSECQFVLNIY